MLSSNPNPSAVSARRTHASAIVASIACLANSTCLAQTTCQENQIVNAEFSILEPIFAPPESFADWGNDFAILTLATAGVEPATPFGMLQFMGTTRDPAQGPSSGGGSAVIQLVDLAPAAASVATGRSIATFSCLFNRVQFDAETDTQFRVEIRAHIGLPEDFSTIIGREFARTTVNIITDGDVETWEPAVVSMIVPVEASYLSVWIVADENIRNDGNATDPDPTDPEFDGHFADSAMLTICDPIPAGENPVCTSCDAWSAADPSDLWSAPMNWLAGTTPIVTDSVTFDERITPLPVSYTVLLDQNETVDSIGVNSGQARFNLDGNDLIATDALTVESSAGVDTRLLLTDTSGGSAMLSSDRIEVGFALNSEADITLRDGTSLMTQRLTVGGSGTATITIEADSILDAGSETVTLASGLGSNATVDIDGSNATLTHAGTLADLIVGGLGDGTINITGGGLLQETSRIENILIGNAFNANGRVSIDGTGSRWTANARSLVIGQGGNGEILVTNGALVDASLTSLLIGRNTGSNGLVVVDGVNSLVDVRNGAVQVGLSGQGEVRVLNGGAFVVGSGLDLLAGAQLCGNGMVAAGDVVNFGAIMPGETPGAIGELTIVTDELRQIGSQQGFARSGTIIIDVDQSNADRLIVLQDDGTGATVDLAGGLFVQSAPGFDPPTNLNREILSAGTLTGSFDVAFLPAIGDERFLFVAPGGTRGTDDTLVLNVGSLDGSIIFDDPDAFDLTGTPSSAASGDFTGDGLTDLAVAIPEANGLLVLRNLGTDVDGTWAGLTTGPLLQLNAPPIALASGNFDDEAGTPAASLDLAVIAQATDDVFVLTNNGTGVFTLEAMVDGGSSPSDIVAANIDGTNFDDIAVTSVGDDTLRLLLGNGIPSDGYMGLDLPVGPDPFCVDPFDPDGDKDVDFAVLLTGRNEVVTIENTDSGFGAPVTFLVGDNPIDLTSEDLNGDGFPELIVINEGQPDSDGTQRGTVSVLRNDPTQPNGPDRFAPAVELPIGDTPRSVTTLDSDGDGDSDIAVLTELDAQSAVVRLLRNDPSTGSSIAFAPAADLPAEATPVLILSGDLDGDDRDDIISVDGSAGGRGPGTERVNVLRALPECIADFDGNGLVETADLLAYLNLWFQQDPGAELTGDTPPQVDTADLLTFLAAWFTGECP